MKWILLFALVLVAGCLESTSTDCPVSQYLDQGVAATYLETDFREILAGNPLNVRVDVNNLGEAIGRNIKGEIIGPDNFYILEKQDWGGWPACEDAEDGCIWESPATLYPPDPERCLEGNVETGKVKMISRAGKQTPSDGVQLRFRLTYDYTSQAWADLIAMDEVEWTRQIKTGSLPQGYQWQSAAPIKIKLIVPDSPIVLREATLGESYPIRIRLDYALIGEAKAVVKSYDKPDARDVCAFVGSYKEAPDSVPNCIRSLTITLQKGLAFDTGNQNAYCGGVRGNSRCADNYMVASGDNPGDPMRQIIITPAKVSPSKKNAEEYVLWVEVTDEPGIIQKTYKITAEADYRMEIVYDTDKVVVSNAS